MEEHFIHRMNIYRRVRVTKFAHKLQTTQIGRNFSCRTSREIIARVPRERIYRWRRTARQSSLSKKVCSIYLAWTEARRWFIVEILLKWTLNSIVEIYDAFARVHVREFMIWRVWKHRHASANTYSWTEQPLIKPRRKIMSSVPECILINRALH